MDPSTFDTFRHIIYEKSGIALREGKESLVSARVRKRMRVLGLDTHEQYLGYVAQDATGQEVVHLIDAISTNVTSFFRENHHFEFLSEAFRRWMNEGQTRFRFWSAASSSGEEPYSLAMTLLENTAGRQLDMKILASDISTRILEKCRHGEYDADKLDTVPRVLLHRYFDKRRDGAKETFAVKAALKKLLVCKRINLAEPPFPMHGPMDVVFCRNVMIYFDQGVRARLLDEIDRLLKPGGYLMVGHAESLTGLIGDFKVVKPSIYVKSPG